MKIHFVTDLDRDGSLFSPPLGIGSPSSFVKREIPGATTTLSHIDENLDKVLADIRPDMVGVSATTRHFLQQREFSIGHFSFADDAMTIDREAVVALCDEIVRKGVNIAIHIATRPDCVDESLLAELKAAGCYSIACGIETAAPRLLD